MLQLWTTSKLGGLDYSLRKKIKFYAPLTESLDFMGIDPVTYSRAGTIATREGRDGLPHSCPDNIPPFYFQGEMPLGIWMFGGLLQYSAQNGLDDANTLVWFDNLVPKSTPTDPSPFDSNGIWTGTLNTYIKHICKANTTLSTAEITALQLSLGDAAQVIAPTIFPPLEAIGSFIKAVPSGARNGNNTVFTLPQNPNPDSMVLVAHGVVCEWVAANPGYQQFTLGGAGLKTVTMGLAPMATGAFFAQYVISA